MASSSIIRRNSYDRLRAMNFDEPSTVYVCDCGQEYMTEETLIKHQQSNCKNRSLKCSFCQDVFPSSTALRDHLLLCGNKTDLCPNCRHLIRRSHFAYHYENNCAPIDEVETPPSRPKSRAMQSAPTNSNKPVLRVDIPADTPPNNYSNHNSPRSNGKSPLVLSVPINSQNLIECEYCRQRCVRTDYQAHKANCLQNPANTNQRNLARTNLISNQKQAPSNGIVHIPCEICQQLIDLPNWSIHTQSCRERENQKITRHVDQQPSAEQLPCEYCGQLYSLKNFDSHQRDCRKNPENLVPARNIPQQRPSPPVMLPVKQSNNQSQPFVSGARSHPNANFAQYQLIDVERTHRANISQNDSMDGSYRNTYQNPIRRTASEENILLSTNHRQALNYDDQSAGSNDHRSYENITRHSRGIPQRSRSSDSLRNSHKGQHVRSNSSDNRRSPNPNDGIYEAFSRNRGREATNVRSNHPTPKRKKASWLARFFGCGSIGNYD